ncbi:MAG: GatB/YqeY domain-containing protein [Chloroflexi bacterium]|nr:GatB/YqeY domain-containing protein [Chloroflexota bacterium]MCH8224422.1 GatB/YqeY domain-containing protein [Chloroflexota bacterium]MCI0845706.1 GatB/YqeY domain-containing protein [Chloroflexota bacterium]
MTLRNKIEEDIRDAQRSRSQARLETLRFLKSAVLDMEKTQGKSLDDPAMLEAINRQVNDRRESIRMFQQGNRLDLVAKESAELAILEAYLPPQLTREELLELIQATIKEVGAESAGDRGRVMGRLMPQVRGRADGAEVNELVTGLLGSGD